MGKVQGILSMDTYLIKKGRLIATTVQGNKLSDQNILTYQWLHQNYNSFKENFNNQVKIRGFYLRLCIVDILQILSSLIKLESKYLQGEQLRVLQTKQYNNTVLDTFVFKENKKIDTRNLGYVNKNYISRFREDTTIKYLLFKLGFIGCVQKYLADIKDLHPLINAQISQQG
ncbi:unnamed protein product (macronuclear) [Paramecium tetraurelia]|uniref:Uncharacterized protein n=1 Tax=Paramecium tetraurelia TaxID=5888 RepID=A0CU01_PARTE|nr:uncharacterized protein GSPATT00039002001 [Paramecium tetraurelia]CAK74268.1 unnamed protein product [Paramecium tetraurelia]|eukprot:XP_001441665.1 hypothetical protein (macronuclear) [Paramecium tetraurelia strain d4-2]